jgi:hypothetical protein
MSIQRSVRFVRFAWLPLLWVACSGNTSVGDESSSVSSNGSPLAVALNMRSFELPSMMPRGSSCTTYHLKPGGPEDESGGAPALDLPITVSQKAVNDTIVVNVTDSSQTVIEKIYDATFVQSGKRDDFTLTSSGQMILLRFWGTVDAGGNPTCEPFTNDGSQLPLQ